MEVILFDCQDKSHPFYLQCAEIHQKEIPNGFLSKLGLNFLASLYYSFSRSQHSFLMLAVENNEVVGFIVISINTKKFFTWYLMSEFLMNFYKIPILRLGSLFFNNSYDILKYPFTKEKETESFVSNSEIFNFCVHRSFQDRGLGTILFNSAIERLKSFNVKRLKIVTGKEQEKAQKFYKKNGANFLHMITVHEEEKSMVFVLNL